jgi:hypothetical protein
VEGFWILDASQESKSPPPVLFQMKKWPQNGKEKIGVNEFKRCLQRDCRCARKGRLWTEGYMHRWKDHRRVKRLHFPKAFIKLRETHTSSNNPTNLRQLRRSPTSPQPSDDSTSPPTTQRALRRRNEPSDDATSLPTTQRALNPPTSVQPSVELTAIQ